MRLPPLPEPSPQPPRLNGEESGQYPVLKRDLRKVDRLLPAIIAGVVSVVGTGGIIVFLVTYAGTVEAKSVAAAQAVVTIHAQRLDVLKGDIDQQRTRLEAIDAGVSAKLEQLESKVEAATRRSEQRADAQEQMLREVLREVRKR